MGGTDIILSVIITIFAVGFATYLFQPVAYAMAYGPTSPMNGLGIEYQIERDQMYSVLLVTPSVLGFGVNAVWAFIAIQRTDPFG